MAGTTIKSRNSDVFQISLRSNWLPCLFALGSDSSDVGQDWAFYKLWRLRTSLLIQLGITARSTGLCECHSGPREPQLLPPLPRAGDLAQECALCEVCSPDWLGRPRWPVGARYGTGRQHWADLPPHSFLGAQPIPYLASPPRTSQMQGGHCGGRARRQKTLSPFERAVFK